KIQMGQSIEFVTHGRWSIHQIVRNITKITGKVDIYLATWTITEEPLRVLYHLKKSDLIGDLYCLFDNRIKERTPKSYQFCSEFATKIGLAKSHAKVVVLENEDWQVTINSSMNWSKNPRTESGVVVCSKASCEFHKKWITEKIYANQRTNN
nr:hypothetical protein [Sediminibacterium sp.]